MKKIENKKICFSRIQFGQNFLLFFFWFWSVISSKLLDGIGRQPLRITGSNEYSHVQAPVYY